jgi:hypothetical protein
MEFWRKGLILVLICNTAIWDYKCLTKIREPGNGASKSPMPIKAVQPQLVRPSHDEHGLICYILIYLFRLLRRVPANSQMESPATDIFSMRVYLKFKRHSRWEI